MDHIVPTAAIEVPPGLSFEQKWEFLKPHIQRFYIDQKLKLVEVIEILKEEYGFNAT